MLIKEALNDKEKSGASLYYYKSKVTVGSSKFVGTFFFPFSSNL